MSSGATAAVSIAVTRADKETAARKRLARGYARYGRVCAGSAVVLALVLVAVFAPLLAPHNPNEINLAARLTPPAWDPEGSPNYLLGTDQLGRDILSRIIFGSRVSLMVGFFSVLTSGLFGILLGLTAGYYGGRLDSVVMRITDIQMALPFMLLALLVVALLGPSLTNVIIVFTVTAWSTYTRIVRASALSVREQQFVEAARALGANDLRIMLRHILPSLISPLLVVASFEMARIITTEAALGFLGLGVPPPTASWGNMISDGRAYVEGAWWISTFPGLVLMMTVLGINLLGDALRDLLDPELRL